MTAIRRQTQMQVAIPAFTGALYTRVLGYTLEQTQPMMEGVARILPLGQRKPK